MRRGANLVCLGTWFDLGTTLLNATAPSRTKMVRAMGFQLKNDIFSVPTSVTYTWPNPTERQTNVTSSLQYSPTNMFCLKGILPYCIPCQAVWASVVMIQGQKSLQSVAILALLKLENSLYFRTCAFLVGHPHEPLDLCPELTIGARKSQSLLWGGNDRQQSPS